MPKTTQVVNAWDAVPRLPSCASWVFQVLPAPAVTGIALGLGLKVAVGSLARIYCLNVSISKIRCVVPRFLQMGIQDKRTALVKIECTVMPLFFFHTDSPAQRYPSAPLHPPSY